jgi:hypothetical protein
MVSIDGELCVDPRLVTNSTSIYNRVLDNIMFDSTVNTCPQLALLCGLGMLLNYLILLSCSCMITFLCCRFILINYLILLLWSVNE